MASMNFSSAKQFVRPPQRGIFPLDHDAECKPYMKVRHACIDPFSAMTLLDVFSSIVSVLLFNYGPASFSTGNLKDILRLSEGRKAATQ